MSSTTGIMMINGLLIILVIASIFVLVKRRKKVDSTIESPVEREVLKVDDEIVLKTIDLSEIGAMFKLIDENRKYLRAWLPWLDDTKDEAGTRLFIESAISQRKKGSGVHYSIYYKDDLVGIIGQTFKVSCQMATIGYWLSESAQNKGVMSRSTQFLVNRDFRELNINRVEIRVATTNIRSRAIPERLDFKEEGRLRSVEWLYDHYVDHVVYGRLKSDDWKL